MNLKSAFPAECVAIAAAWHELNRIDVRGVRWDAPERLEIVERVRAHEAVCPVEDCRDYRTSLRRRSPSSVVVPATQVGFSIDEVVTALRLGDVVSWRGLESLPCDWLSADPLVDTVGTHATHYIEPSLDGAVVRLLEASSWTSLPPLRELDVRASVATVADALEWATEAVGPVEAFFVQVEIRGAQPDDDVFPEVPGVAVYCPNGGA